MFITTVCVLFLIKLSQVIDPLVLLFVVILFLSFFHISNCTVSKQRSFIRQKLCHDILIKIQTVTVAIKLNQT